MSKRKILIIDDDPDINNLFKLFLEYDGYKVNAYMDPLDALYAFRKNTFDLVLLDLKMPKMSGMLLYHKLRNLDPNLLFCFITADKEYIKHLKKSIGEIEKIVIYKPILLRDLRSKVNSGISEKKSKLMIMA
ncbi:MAG TPA: response regulator [Nitrososphaeraceae archaeon]|nr:response regulator [Nitrososphaeraceae archaeon]